MFGEKPSKEEKESLLAAAHAAMTKLEQQIGHHFIAGEHLSIADVQVFFELTLFKVMFAHDLDSSHSHLAQWHHRVAHSHPVLTASYNEYLTTLTGLLAKIPEEEKDQDVIELYWNPISQPARTLKNVLDIAIPDKYTLHAIDLFKGEHKSPEFLAKNPMGQVPALIVNGTSMNESASILRYIASKYKLAELYPEDFTARHKVDMMLDFNGNTLRPQLLGALRKLAFGPIFGGPKPSYKLWKDTIEGAKTTLEKFGALLQGTYVAGNFLSIADIQSFFEVTLFVEMLKYDLSHVPKINEWYH